MTQPPIFTPTFLPASPPSTNANAEDGSTPIPIPVSPYKRRKRLSASTGNKSTIVSPQVSQDNFQPVIEIDQHTGIDLSAIPRDYLELYPYPSFALVVPIPPTPESQDITDDLASPSDDQLPFTRIKHDALQPFDILWANEKWRNLTQKKPLLECLSIQGARDLGDWLSGARALRAKGELRIPVIGGSAKTGATFSGPPSDPAIPSSPTYSTSTAEKNQSQAPIGFWEPDYPPYEDRSSNSDQASSSDVVSIGVAGKDGGHPGPSTLKMELASPGTVTLELTKTMTPVWRLTAAGTRSRMSTHSLAIITTTPRSSFIPNDDRDNQKLNPKDDDAMQVDGEEPHRPPVDALHANSADTVQCSPTLRERAPANEPLSGQTTRPLLTVSNPGQIKPDRLITPTEELEALDLFPTGDRLNSPLISDRDGSVSHPKNIFAGTDLTSGGKSLDCHVLLDTTDWAKTDLGPRDSWPQSLKSIVSLMMGYPHQCCLWWGKELTIIYNEHYGRVIPKHPHIFGMSGPVAWAEIWDSLGPMSDLVLSGTPMSKEDDLQLFKQLPHQGNATHEFYFTWMWVPVMQEDGRFGGLWNATIETTKKVLAERRLATVREMGERTSIARTMTEFDSAVIDILGSNPKDVPFAALYHIDISNKDQRATGGNRSFRTEARVRLAGSVGVPEHHPSTPSCFKITIKDRNRSLSTPFSYQYTPAVPGSPTMSTYSSVSGATPLPRSYEDEEADMTHLEQWPIGEALRTRRLVLVEDCSALIDGFPVRAWDELPTAAIVVPISNDSDEGTPTAVLVLGLNIRRPFDDDYDSFVHLLRLQLASGITAVGSYEAERQRIEDMAALDRAKSLLFSNVSHELRTPLTLVAGPLEDLLLETPDGPRKDMLITARRNVRRLTRLVSTLMDVSRLEAGRMKGSFRPANLGVVTRDLAGLFRNAIERAKLRYVVDCDLSPKNVFVDPEHWEKIVFNLIGNAMKYTMSGFVNVRLHYTKGEAILLVEDSGVGIPASDIDLVGSRFHRVESVSRSHEGTGIGLSLIKELIKLHGGVLEIESHTAEESMEGTHGSTFRVRIPLGSAHLPSEAIDVAGPFDTAQTGYGQGIVDEAMQWTRDKESSSASSDGTAPSSGESVSASASSSSRGFDPSTLYFEKQDVIMIVDDSSDVRRYVKSIFASYCSVVEARDGQEALELCKKNRPDLIISDVMMPRLDGFGLLNGLKLIKELALIPFIMLTARGGDEAKIDGLLAGADDYVAKPFNSREIIARAHMQLQLGKKRRHLEMAFDERTVELRAISEYSPVGIFRCNDDQKITFANGAWYEMSGFPANEPDSNWQDYIMHSQVQVATEFADDIFGKEEVMSAGDFQFTNGRWVSAKVIRLDLIAPGMKGVLGCVTDITERKKHEELQRQRVIEAEQRRIEAEEAKRQQELLIDITSHEIRNPISSLMQIKQLEEVLENEKSFIPTKQLLNNIDEDVEALESIYQCGLAQERISNDVLSLGKIQLDMLQMFDVEVEMRHEAQKVIGIFQNEARMKRIALALDVGENLKKSGLNKFKTDPVRLNQVVTNLISNAIRFTATSEVRRIVLSYDVSFEPPEGNNCLAPPLRGPPPVLKADMPIFMYFAVTDTGPGMTPKELEMLFQRFSQVSPKTHTIFGGSGLGLFVCRKITELMGGRIEVVSEKGKGSTFRFFIQARTCQTDLNNNAEESSGQTSSSKRRNVSKTKMSTIKGKKPHVLIVEDNLINQTVLARQLRHCNLTCDVASHGEEALEKIRAVSSLNTPPEGQAYDCVLMDLEMPVMDGLTAVKIIREEEKAGKLSLNLVIALTGNARQGQIDEARRCGMDEVVIKPYRLDDLLHKIEGMMKIRAEQAAQAVVAVGQVKDAVAMSMAINDKFGDDE